MQCESSVIPFKIVRFDFAYWQHCRQLTRRKDRATNGKPVVRRGELRNVYAANLNAIMNNMGNSQHMSNSYNGGNSVIAVMLFL